MEYTDTEHKKMTTTKETMNNTGIINNTGIDYNTGINNNREISYNKGMNKNMGNHETMKIKRTNKPRDDKSANRNPHGRVNENPAGSRFRILINESDSESEAGCDTDQQDTSTGTSSDKISTTGGTRDDRCAGPLKSILRQHTGIDGATHQKRVRFKGIRVNGNKKRKGKNKLKTLRILYANVNGIKDKMTSLQNAAETYGAHIVAVVETKQIPPRLEGYGIWNSKERKNKGGGGVAIAARNDVNSKIIKVDNLDEDEQDVVWVELKKSLKENLYIGVYYGKQESASREDVENEFDQLNTQINVLATKGEVIITGDFNAKLEIKEENYHQQLSSNGKYLKNMIEMNRLQSISTRKENVRWTRQNPNNPDEKYIINYIITTKGISNHINELIIDENGIHRIKGKKESDHNTILMEINIGIRKETKIIKRWNLENKEGWLNFNKEMKSTYENSEPQTQEELQSTINSILKKTVGQNTIRTGTNKPKETQEIKQLRLDKSIARKAYQNALKHSRETIPEKLEKYFKVQSELKAELEKTNKIKTQQKLEKMIHQGKLNAVSFWKMKSKTEKSNEQELYDTITEEGIHLKTEDETKQYVADYFEELYQARPGKKEYEQKTKEIEDKVKEIEIEMLNKPKVKEFTEEELTAAIKKLRRKKSTGPDDIPNELFIEADNNTKQIIMEAFNKINREMEIPQEWQKGEICRIYKAKGTKGKCSNERGITLSSDFGKLYERMINERITPMVKISDAQAGGKKGSATVDHLLLLKELINAARRDKKRSLHSLSRCGKSL